MSRLYMMVTITDRNRKKKFEEFYKKNEHMVFFTTLGRGTANSEMLDYFGLEESEKVVILSVVTEETWKKLRREMIVKMQIDVREPELHLSCHSAASAEKKHYIS